MHDLLQNTSTSATVKEAELKDKTTPFTFSKKTSFLKKLEELLKETHPNKNVTAASAASLLKHYIQSPETKTFFNEVYSKYVKIQEESLINPGQDGENYQAGVKQINVLHEVLATSVYQFYIFHDEMKQLAGIPENQNLPLNLPT